MTIKILNNLHLSLPNARKHVLVATLKFDNKSKNKNNAGQDLVLTMISARFCGPFLWFFLKLSFSFRVLDVISDYLLGIIAGARYYKFRVYFFSNL